MLLGADGSSVGLELIKQDVFFTDLFSWPCEVMLLIKRCLIKHRAAYKDLRYSELYCLLRIYNL